MAGQVRRSRTLRDVAKIVVDVMLKPEIHDPQGEAITGACHRLGFTEVVAVRQGKRFEVEIGEPGAAGDRPAAAGADAMTIRVAELAAELLANPIIEEFAIHGP
jgi:phosphoribosylformylglycinamidine synthase PurS subunit